MSFSPPDLSESLTAYREAAVGSCRGVVPADAGAEDLEPKALLYEEQELTSPELAQMQPITSATAKSRLHRPGNSQRAALAEGRTFCGDEQGVQAGATRSPRSPQGTN